MTAPTHGRSRDGDALSEARIQDLASRAEAGFDVEAILKRRVGRPSIGSSAASVESVRLDPELSQALRRRAEAEGRTNSDLIRDALRNYLRAS
jgi:Ribbon-helix-helix protein, copG family